MKVLTLSSSLGPDVLPWDLGASGAFQKLLKTRTTASVLHVTAHPDDEHAGMLTYLGRGLGVRTALVSLTRGESGQNAVGSELFETLGILRTEELKLAARYYGLDDLYFGTAFDYGYSRRIEEAHRRWDFAVLVRDVVRAIRVNRPLVVVSRYTGAPCDGHAHHRMAGVVAREAFRVAGDANAFPELADEGLRPWQPLKLYVGEVAEGRPVALSLDVGVYSPWLGRAYAELASMGYAMQRSQTAGRVVAPPYPRVHTYERIASSVETANVEQSFFDGIDTSLRALPELLRIPGAKELTSSLGLLEGCIEDAIAACHLQGGVRVTPHLARALRILRASLAEPAAQDAELVFVLRIKERQLENAVHAVLGLRVHALATVNGDSPPEHPFFPFATMGPVSPRHSFMIDIRGAYEPAPNFALRAMTIDGPLARAERIATEAKRAPGAFNERFQVMVAGDAPLSSPYLTRVSPHDTFYDVLDPAHLPLPTGAPAYSLSIGYEVDGVRVTAQEAVRVREPDEPYGYALRELAIIPEISVSLEPELVVVHCRTDARARVTASVLNHGQQSVSGELSLVVPGEWRCEPATQTVQLEPGASAHHAFTLVRAVASEPRANERVHACVRTSHGTYEGGSISVAQRDLERRWMHRPAATIVRALGVEMSERTRVGYVAGPGDSIPLGIAQLDAELSMLGESELARGSLDSFDCIVVGTRAYAVRQDLVAHNDRLLSYAREGGHVVVLYQTREFDPARQAPFPAELPVDASEVCEEDAAVTLVSSDHPMLRTPNVITSADFDGWIEQRGSKILRNWHDDYVALIEAHDEGEPPERGLWLTARFGTGAYTYCSLALHRQLPFGVEGAFRILANLLSYRSSVLSSQ